jgi:deoxyribose-phosphate aldolase/dTMP kinase
MKKNFYPGKFIVFEGLDGSGQSTQAKLLKEFLNKEADIILTKEPTLDSDAGRKIREVLDKKIEIQPNELQELFTQDRKEHLENLIIPNLKEGKIVISDRYFFSTFAYGAADGLDLNWLIEINNSFLLPNLTFFLKVSPEMCIKRIEKRGEKKTLFEKKEKLIRVWQIYQILLNRFENIYLIDGEKSIENVFSQIEKIFKLKIMKNINVAKLIDQTFLKREASDEEIKRICEETKKYNFRALCIFPEHTKLSKELLKDTDIKITTLIDEPTGISSHEQRIKMVEVAKKNGSDEIELVMKIDVFKNKKYDEVLFDLKELCQILPTKVIIGSGYLTDEEIKKASELTQQAGAICVKTATVDDPLDNKELIEKAKHIRIMKETAPDLLIKASGGIRTLKDVEMMIEAGADIIGTSSGKEIVYEIKGIDIDKIKDGRIVE